MYGVYSRIGQLYKLKFIFLKLNYFNRNEKGVALIEILIGLFICLCLCTSLNRVAHNTVKLKKLVKRRYQNSLTLLQLEHRFKRILEDFDSHPLLILPRIHQNNELSFINNDTLEVKNLTGNSDAITALGLEINEMYEVVKQDGLFLFACPRYKRLSDNNFGFIALGVDGFWEMQGKYTHHVGRLECLDIRLYEENSMLINNTNDTSEMVISILIPIRDYYSLVVDKNQQLRYLSHRGNKITENQPLFNNVSALKIALDNEWNGIICLKVEATFTDLNKRTFSACNHLGRYQYLNFIMNQSGFIGLDY